MTDVIIHDPLASRILMMAQKLDYSPEQLIEYLLELFASQSPKNIQDQSKSQLNDISRLVEYCITHLDLPNAKLSDEFYYHSLPLCVIDAVFSIGVRYTSTQNVVHRFCHHFALPVTRSSRLSLPPTSEQISISQVIKIYNELGGAESMAKTIYQNLQRTSTQSGILKSEAVLRFSKVLWEFGVAYLQDVNQIFENPDFEARIKTIPGQTSGISLKYFYMLVGADEYIKPDRMIRRFVFSAIQKDLGNEETQHLVVEASHILSKQYPHLTPRTLDYTNLSFG